MDGIEHIRNERKRQIEIGWSLEHDDDHTNEELASAAAFYSLPEKYGWYGWLEILWPWRNRHKKGDYSRIHQLEVAGALIAAEIDRLLRL